MTQDYDYKNLGFKAGLEIHQELEVSTKLFCNCPARLEKREPDYYIKRYFRPVMGELGEFDKAMLVEYEKNKKIIYEGYFESTCTYELDETPPFNINQEAVDLGLMVALLLEGDIIDELHICRKNYLDGSVTCGFQRTLIVGLRGVLPLRNKKIGINTISIEEDAARKIKTEGNRVYYRLDRLGIPLIELVTDPVLESPEEIFEAAYRIGLLLRSTGKVKRGLGTVRQDINLSIKGGARVELKGVQKLDWIKRLVDHEIERQLNLIEIKNQLLEIGISSEEIKNTPEVLNDIFNNTNCKLIKNSIQKGKIVLGIRLPSFKGILGKKIQLDKSFGYEIAERVTSLTGLKGIIHSDEDFSKYKINEKEVQKIKERLKASENDAFALVVGEADKAKKAIKVITERCKLAFKGVPLETRRALEDGKSRFERELHGGARLYPDTDTPPIQISEERIKKIKEKLPPYPWELERKYSKKYSLPEKNIRSLILEDRIDLFLKIVEELKVDPVLVSTTLIETLKAIKRENLDISKLSDNKIYDMFNAIKKGLVAKEAIEDILIAYINHPEDSLENILNKIGLKKVTSEELEKIIDSVIEKNNELIEKRKERSFSALMGEVMRVVRGKIDGKIVSEMLKEKMKKLGVLK
ncbi:MAG: Glu-tRNA(Gln) amidotransferase subunit GatE [Candidatus Odinarchaeia archaeon]